MSSRPPLSASCAARMQAADRIKLTGWGPFVSLNRPPFEPVPRDALIETWLGAVEADRWSRTPAHCDFWQADRSGRLFLQRGYDEDGLNDVPPGTFLDITIPIWRVGEAALYVARLAREFGDAPSIVMFARYVGLHGRTLTRTNSIDRFFLGQYLCNEDEVSLEAEFLTAEIEDNLAEALQPFLFPLYEKFDFFDLEMELVVRELDKLRRGRF